MNRPPMALDPEDAEALSTALLDLDDSTPQDRTAGAALLMRLRTERTLRVTVLARLAKEAIFARRNAKRARSPVQE